MMNPFRVQADALVMACDREPQFVHVRDMATGLMAKGVTHEEAFSRLAAKVQAEREAQDILLGPADAKHSGQSANLRLNALVCDAWRACAKAYDALLRLPLVARATPMRQADLSRLRDAIAILTDQDPELVQATHEASVTKQRPSNDREEAQRLAVAFLNENFEPWTFSGPEPVTEALVALLLRVRAGVHARPVNELVAGADRL